jgi:hypothetical protein
VRPRRGRGPGREVRDVLTSGVHGSERERMRACENKRCRQTGPTEQREGEKGRGGWRRQAGSACQGLRARVGGGLACCADLG